MLLYNITFPNKQVCDINELYFRGGELRDNGVFVKSGDTVTFDTYFNSFSHIKYKKYTKITSVTLRLHIDGDGVASIRRYVEDGEDEIVTQKRISGEDELSFDISSLLGKGFLYFSFSAQSDSVILGGDWRSDTQPRPIKIGVVICTFKREEYLRRNVANLSEYMKQLGERFFDVYIVDNARTVTDDFGEGVTVIPNQNTGGSGGFTRGMKEVCSKDYTHFLLMDDDILFDVNILKRTEALLSVLKDEYKDASVGGAMLNMDRPYLQEELGADWTGDIDVPRRHRLDARDVETISGNEEDGEPNYNAWFYMCMPTNAPKKYGYPLPFFIRCDDTEYSLRAAEHIIVTSGIGVWHDAFDLKYSPEMEYYIRRNELILCSRYPNGKGFFANWKKLALGIAKNMVLQRYYAADLRFKAYDDFLKGPDFFLNLNSEENHLELRQYCPRFMTKDELEAEYAITVLDNPPKSTKKWGLKNLITLNGYLIPKCFHKKGITQVEMTNYGVDDFALKINDLYLKRKVLHFNTVTGKGFVTEIKKSAMFKYAFKLVKYFFKLLFHYKKTAKKYAEIDVMSL